MESGACEEKSYASCKTEFILSFLEQLKGISLQCGSFKERFF